MARLRFRLCPPQHSFVLTLPGVVLLAMIVTEVAATKTHMSNIRYGLTNKKTKRGPAVLIAASITNTIMPLASSGSRQV